MNNRERDYVIRFLRESNTIEGIHREPTDTEIDASIMFLGLMFLDLNSIASLVSVYQPDAVLRSAPGLNVRVGNYVAPAGGPRIKAELELILRLAYTIRGEERDAWLIHKDYENLHPFTDGNGRSGRMLWFWVMMGKYGEWRTAINRPDCPLFLQMFYYQTLQFNR